MPPTAAAEEPGDHPRPGRRRWRRRLHPLDQRRHGRRARRTPRPPGAWSGGCRGCPGCPTGRSRTSCRDVPTRRRRRRPGAPRPPRHRRRRATGDRARPHRRRWRPTRRGSPAPRSPGVASPRRGRWPRRRPPPGCGRSPPSPPSRPTAVQRLAHGGDGVVVVPVGLEGLARCRVRRDGRPCRARSAGPPPDRGRCPMAAAISSAVAPSSAYSSSSRATSAPNAPPAGQRQVGGAGAHGAHQVMVPEDRGGGPPGPAADVEDGGRRRSHVPGLDEGDDPGSVRRAGADRVRDLARPQAVDGRRPPRSRRWRGWDRSTPA